MTDPKNPETGRGDAGTDTSIEERLEKNPESKQARLDRALDESMDASDPPATTQPIHSQEAPPSSGFDPEKEKALAEERARQADA
jgi:hypothetical protein